jgi:hypothetical protein
MSFPTNGGWKFRQPQTNWENPYALVGKEVSITAIRKHRLANPAIAAKHGLSTDPAVIENELVAFNQARGALPPPVQPTFFQPSSSRLPSRVVAAAADIKRAAQGTAVVLDWLTSGGAPVAQELASRRAATCIGCVKNVEGSWFTVAPAELIKNTLEARKDLKLVTPSDAALQSCDVCKCLNRLKVWCPIKHIVAKTKPEIMAEFPTTCWIKCESASVT